MKKTIQRVSKEHSVDMQKVSRRYRKGIQQVSKGIQKVSKGVRKVPKRYQTSIQHESKANISDECPKGVQKGSVGSTKCTQH